MRSPRLQLHPKIVIGNFCWCLRDLEKTLQAQVMHFSNHFLLEVQERKAGEGDVTKIGNA